MATMAPNTNNASVLETIATSISDRGKKIQKQKYTNTNAQIQTHKYTNTNTKTIPLCSRQLQRAYIDGAKKIHKIDDI